MIQRERMRKFNIRLYVNNVAYYFFYFKIFITDSILHFEIVEKLAEELVEHPIRASKVYSLQWKHRIFVWKKFE